jgi:hypothetical protein
MRFRLTYEGELKASGRDPETGQRDPMAEHKQAIRKVFHAQLRQLWATNEFLHSHTLYRDEFRLTPARAGQTLGRIYTGGGTGPQIPLAEYIASKFELNGYRFVPLVCEDFSLLCSLQILFLRRDFPSGVVSAGDLDNRIKTLIDTLRMPKSANELRGNETPSEDEKPFFCLLEDDDLVTGLSVETDMLLNPDRSDSNQVKLVISVELKPANATMFNLSFS